MNKDRFRGMFTALVTPMLEDGQVDFESLQRLVDHQIAEGIYGFYVGGSTGEAFLLSSDERMQVLESVIRATRQRVPVVAHIGCISTMESVRLAKHAEQAGADAVSAVVPFYYKVSLDAIRSHYESIMASVTLPLIVYHFPGATGVTLSMDFYEAIARNPQCLGVKFTSYNLFEMQQIRKRCGDGFFIWNGHDEVYAGGALLGADGAIGSTFNMMPGLFAELYRKQSEGQWETARPLQEKANEVIAHMLNYEVIPYEKYILYLQGVLRTPTVRQPLHSLTAAEQEEIKAFYTENKVLTRK